MSANPLEDRGLTSGERLDLNVFTSGENDRSTIPDRAQSAASTEPPRRAWGTSGFHRKDKSTEQTEPTTDSQPHQEVNAVTGQPLTQPEAQKHWDSAASTDTNRHDDDINAFAFGSKDDDQSTDATEHADTDTPEPVETDQPADADDFSAEESPSESEDESTTDSKPEDTLSPKEIAKQNWEADLAVRAYELAREQAMERTFPASKGLKGLIRTVNRHYTGIDQADLDKQIADFIEKVLPGALLDARVEALVLRLNELKQLLRRIVVLNSKGGSGKTPLAVYLVTCWYWAVGRSTIIIDSNENDGTTTDLIGVDPLRTKTSRWCMRNLDQFTDCEAAGNLLDSPFGSGIFVVASDQGATVDFDKEQFARMATKLIKTTATAGFFDGGNGNNVASNEGAAMVATDIVLACRADDPLSFKGVLSSMLQLVKLGHAGKVNRAYIVVNKADQDKSYYMGLLREWANKIKVFDGPEDTTGRMLTIDELNIVEERLFLVPFDQYIMDRGIADANKIKIETLIAFLEILVAIYEREEDQFDQLDPALDIASSETDSAEPNTPEQPLEPTPHSTGTGWPSNHSGAWRLPETARPQQYPIPSTPPGTDNHQLEAAGHQRNGVPR